MWRKHNPRRRNKNSVLGFLEKKTYDKEAWFSSFNIRSSLSFSDWGSCSDGDTDMEDTVDRYLPPRCRPFRFGLQKWLTTFLIFGLICHVCYHGVPFQIVPTSQRPVKTLQVSPTSATWKEIHQRYVSNPAYTEEMRNYFARLEGDPQRMMKVYGGLGAVPIQPLNERKKERIEKLRKRGGLQDWRLWTLVMMSISSTTALYLIGNRDSIGPSPSTSTYFQYM